MGIGHGTIKLLMQEALRRPLAGRVLTLGKQDVSITQEDLEEIAADSKFPLHPSNGIDPISTKGGSKEQRFISDVYLLARLGFSNCKSMDYSDYEGCDYVFDLNQPDLPPHLMNAFDVVIDGGTMEHVFHLPNVLRNLFNMIPVNGRIIHCSPSSNHMDHGFYMFSPTLFWDYYEANRFDINQFVIIRHSPWPDFPWRIWEYKPGLLNGISYGGLDGAMYAIHCVVTKNQHSLAGIIPQQRNYQEGAWKGKKELALSGSWLTAIKRGVKKSPALYRSLRSLVHFLRRRRGLSSKTATKL
ncbi:MAG TPA: hypothetical protein VLE89_06585 [Chlamydiales bacterium]|nr:hypothetical protein [Chlamydiales bacterium]